EFSGMGYAGTGSVGIEFVRLFQVELEHYEKMEGRSLSLEGKANRLAFMVRGNLAAAMQGLVVVPLFVGYDEDSSQGRIFSYDVACVQALYDAADDDSATGGPDLPRRIFPVVATITADGFRKLPAAEAAQVAEQVIRERLANPDGPPAALRNG